MFAAHSPRRSISKPTSRWWRRSAAATRWWWWGTARNHLLSAIGKTGATNRAEAVRIAESNGWL